MKSQYEHEVVSSFLLFLDHQLCSRGRAYTNYASNFYPVQKNYLKPDGTNYYTYGSPFKQFVYDQSVIYDQGDGKRRAPEIPSGIYLGETYVKPGELGLSSIDFNRGELHFAIDYPATLGVLPSANYAVKDFNVYLTNEPENKLLFETQYKLNPRISQNPTGLAPNAETYPAIYVRNLNSDVEHVGLPNLLCYQYVY